MMDSATSTESPAQPDGSVEAIAARIEAAQEQPEPAEQTIGQPETASIQQEEIEEETQETESNEPEVESEEPEVYTVNELAEALDWTPEQLMSSLNLTTKVNGKETTVNLGDLKEGFQKGESFTQKSQELAAERKAFVEETVKGREEMAQRQNQAQAMSDMLQNNLMSEYKNVDWQDLRQSDPAEYAALMADFQNRHQEIGQIGAELQRTQQVQQNEQQQEALQQQAKFLEAEKDALLSAIPEWNDAETAKKGRAEMSGFLLNDYGFNESEVNSIMDHRIVLLVKDAMKAKGAAKQSEIGKKKLKLAPKLNKPGVRQGKNFQQQQRTQELKAKLKKSGGNVNDVAELLLDRM